MTDQVTRTEHLAWCKRRALEYLATGDLRNAVASMTSDLSKHPDIKPNTTLLAYGLICVINNDANGARRWIEGFN